MRNISNVKFDLLNYLDETNEEFLVYRKVAFSNRRGWLNPQTRSILPADYERLKKEYAQMRKEYKIERPLFFRIKRSATEDEWEKHWEEFCDEKFPALFLNKEVQSLSAAELAYKQLAEIFDLSDSYMKKIIQEARKQVKKNG